MSGITAISSSSPDQAQARGGGDLQAQKAQCERQLADWVHCVSAKTPEGKAKIAKYSGKLSAINTQIKKADDARAQARQALEQRNEAPRTARDISPLQTTGSVLDTWA